MTAGGLEEADNVKICGSPAKTRTGWESKAREIAVAIARPANGRLGETSAVNCEQLA